ncbi:hypothetical protein [Streptomyces sp. NPDC048623]|uniref:hypothetical protein n=1 Tax=Streptomyces sp. NPDC048623 TaxID=3155761 RepID=UPI0034452051
MKTDSADALPDDSADDPEVASLLDDLAGADPARLTRHADALLPALLRSLAGVQSSAALAPARRAFGFIGPTAFDAVLAAWRRKELTDWQAGHLLGAFDERCADRYAALAADPHYGTSGHGFMGLVRLRTDSEAGVRALADRYGSGLLMPYKGADYARLMDESFRPRLRTMRRDPAVPARARRGALAALVAGGGTDALDARDRAAIERLIRVKIPHEVPRLPDSTLSGWWMAVPGASYEGVFEALGLHERRPVTVACGVAAAGGRAVQVPGPEREGAARFADRAFVTPELDGWRLVFGSFDTLVGEDWEDMTETVERVSAHCGQAQLFFLDDAGGSDVWMVAEQGRVIRQYAAEGDPEWEGDPLPWETLAVDDEDFDPEYDEAPANAGTTGARSACAYLSADPGAVGPDTAVRGHGWLAVTAPGVGHGAFPGVLPI